MPTGIYQRSPMPEEHKRAISNSLKGKKKPTRTKEHIEKLRIANLGKVHSEETKRKMSESGKGKHHYWLGKKLSKEHRAKISFANLEEKRPLWKGDKVGYSALHDWVALRKGKSPTCSDCGIKGKYIFMKNGRKRWSIEWSNIDGKYRRKLEDFIAKCIRCHRIYDLSKIRI